MRRRTVLITGGNGRLGRVLRDALPAQGWRVRTLDLSAAEPRASGAYVGSITDPELMLKAAKSVDAIVHLGGLSQRHGHGWEDYLAMNVDGTRVVLEAARLRSVPRVILASSCHAVGFTPRTADLADDTPARPDTFYGVSKVALEGLGALYAELYGVETTSLRIGACQPRPTDVRTLSIWLSYPDFVRLIDASLTAPWNGHRTIWGASRNTRRWWSYAGGNSIGFDPQDDAEAWADQFSGEEPQTVGGDLPTRFAAL